VILRIAGVGAAFVVCVVGGFWIGVTLAARTGASWWALAGMAGGLIAGVAAAVATARRALHE
jgi:di/tricarboxylate transporter